MALRNVDVRNGDGTAKTIVYVTRQEVIVQTSTVTLDAIMDDGAKITAAVRFVENNNSKVLTLFEGIYYEPIANFTNTEIDNRIKEVIAL
ncbi:MAG TPA: hypothetical protein VD905_15530 [Flavobacteriales bacterium]|nr:hypothetical protein [Flavobacteriales bacterium]